MAKAKGLYGNIHAKKKRIAAGSGEKMRRPGAKGAPTAANFKRAAKTAKKKRIKAGSGEKMRKVGSKGAPTKQAFINSAKTAKKKPKKKKA